MTTFNPFASFLEDRPEATYFSYGDRFGGAQQNPRQQRFYSKQFSDIFNQYLGALGKQIRAGLPPSEKFNDFLGGFDFDDWYRKQQSSQERNLGSSGFAPSLQWKIPGIHG